MDQGEYSVLKGVILEKMIAFLYQKALPNLSPIEIREFEQLQKDLYELDGRDDFSFVLPE
jgi:hypothetical protein